jgi:hypothetical protein
VVNPNGSFTYTPDDDFNGTDSFSYTVSDGNGGTDTATVTATVTPVNDAPVAVDEAVTVAEDSGATVINVLGNDTDVDGDTLTFDGFTQATNGTVSLNNGVLTYAPNANFNGTDSFTYFVSDGNGGTDTGQVSITVSSVTTLPWPTTRPTRSTKTRP